MDLAALVLVCLGAFGFHRLGQLGRARGASDLGRLLLVLGAAAGVALVLTSVGSQRHLIRSAPEAQSLVAGALFLLFAGSGALGVAKWLSSPQAELWLKDEA